MRFVHYFRNAMGDSGVTIALWAWARAMASNGHEVVVLHAGPLPPYNPPRGFAHTGAGEGVTDRAIPHRGRGRVSRVPVRLAEYLKPGDVLVLHEGWVASNLVAAAAARAKKIPYIVMPHGVYDGLWQRYLHGPRFIRYRMERHMLERAAAVHVFFHTEISDISAVAPGAHFITVPTGFEVPEERWTGGGGYLSWIGRIDPLHKGLDLIVRAIACLSPSDRPHLRIHGYDYKGGSEVLRRLVHERAVDSCVEFGGIVTEPEKTLFLQRADGYVHPSRWESHSIALLENLGLGVPSLISSAVHYAHEVAGSSAAILADPTEESLADGLCRLSNADPALGARARLFVRERFSWGALVPEFLSELRRLGLE